MGCLSGSELFFGFPHQGHNQLRILVGFPYHLFLCRRAKQTSSRFHSYKLDISFHLPCFWMVCINTIWRDDGLGRFGRHS
jgi:hypothetical protein